MVRDLEDSVRKIGREIYSLMTQEVPSIFDRKTWNGRLMEWAMKDEDVRVQLFRFVDVLPCLKSDALVVRMLNEYFEGVKDNPLLQGLGRVSTMLPRISAKVARRSVESLAAQFIAGRDHTDTLKSVLRLRDQGIGFTIDLLGEEVLSEKEAAVYVERYLNLLNSLSPEVLNWPEIHTLDADQHGPLPRIDISLKVSSFYSQLDPTDWEVSIQRAKAGLAPVIKRAVELGAAVTIDMEQYYYKDLTIAVLKSLLEEHSGLSFGGIALQAYLPETKSDLLGIIEWAKLNNRRVTVRLVKGAYWDYETVINRQKGWPVPVFLQKEKTDRNFEDLTRILLENPQYVRPAIATHNIRSISQAIAVANSLGLPKEALEFQVIYGMAEPIRSALQKMNYRVRAYTPVGALIPGMAYLIRRLLENTSNESFLRKSFSEKLPFDELIKAPQPPEEPASDEVPDRDFANEPATDFSRSQNPQRMKEALQKVKKGFNKTYPLLIGHDEVWKDKYSLSLNPAAPVEVVGKVGVATKDDAEKAVHEATRAWREWSKTPAEGRAAYLFKAAEEMRMQRFELMALEVYEVGKTWADADGDVAEAIDYLEYYARGMIKLGQPKILGNYPGEANEYLYEPRGIGVVISPWNFPLAIPTGMVSAGLVAGNCVIFKPSGLSPILGWKLVEIFRGVGLPAGVLHFVPGPGAAVGEYLVAHPGVDFIAFTGSKEVGLNIVKLAGETHLGQRSVKRVIAEMGGKNAIIIDDTADPDEAVKGVLESALSFQGQKCSACSRAIVVGDLYEEFCDRLKEAMVSIMIGPPEDPQTYMGPVVDEAAKRKILRYIELGETEGRPLLKRKAPEEGCFVGPAIFTDVSPNAKIAQEEIFGPVLIVFKAPNIERAIEIANSTPYALTGGIFSRSPGNIRKAKAEFMVGNLYINRKITGALVGRQPFGGFGMSGVSSKAGGPDYLLQFTNIRSISENTLRRGFAPKAPEAS
ncbi:MAG: bifunctional proline dehydrogenase/L-glutamate gamma-semialdehyde dehydrogenase [Desulfomonile tiedjei]|nr:bifunctional proline dehydrogenase/L-glutamate gamma-semialdehyde dehydrogenase [Desulfomonile tiedjei]